MDFEDLPNPTISLDQALATPDLEALRQSLLARHSKGDYPQELHRILSAMYSYERAYHSEFGREHDDFKLVGQDNIRRYLPVNELRIRVHPTDSSFDIVARVCASRIVGCRTTVSVPVDHTPEMVALLDNLTRQWGAAVEFVEESDAELAALIAAGGTSRVRYAGPGRAPEQVLKAVDDTGIFIAQTPVLAEGRLELLWYVREQSISHNYHRYGNLGARAKEERRKVQ
jgi:RHH-type proline utilization regulon transcriptional repressor/proline dehydrogenase/delta 1-pyrroline-5-carboxylate dehydrogenase